MASRLKYKVQSLFLVKAIVGSARSSFRASSRSRHNIAEHLSWDGWSNRAGKVAYESRRDYIIAVKGKMRLRVTLSTQSESAAFRRISLISSSGDLWCGVVHDGVNIAEHRHNIAEHRHNIAEHRRTSPNITEDRPGRRCMKSDLRVGEYQ